MKPLTIFSLCVFLAMSEMSLSDVFNSAAGGQLLENGIEQLVFIRRNTLNGNHVYTEYVNSRWLPGGGVCVLDLKTGSVRELAPEFTKNGVVGWLDVSFDAKKIVFDFKKSALEGYRLYEINTDGSGFRQLTFPPENEDALINKYGNKSYHRGTDDLEPCYLPDGGIVFASTRCQFSVLCDSSDNFTVKNLYRIENDGSNLQQLTYSALSEATPTLMPDGRVMYHRWEYVDKSAGNAKGIWSMNPDGSGVSEKYGNSISFPETMIQARSIQGVPNKFVMLGASHCCPNNALGTVILVDTKKDTRSQEAMRYVTDDVAAFHHNGFHFKDENGNWIHDLTGKPGRLFRNPFPITEKLFLVSHKPKGLNWDDPKGYDLSVLDENGKETLLYKDELISCWHPYPLVVRDMPAPTAPPSYDPFLAEEGLSQCLAMDIYVGMENVKRGDVKYIRILEQIPRPWAARKSYREDGQGTTHAHSAVGDGLLSVKVQHGVVPVEDDGSANFVVPAERAIYFQALDENFNAIQTERTYVNYRRGEMRSCIGCHETPNNTPLFATKSVPKAMRRSPSVPMPQQSQNDAKILFDYDRQIQPIWNKHCVNCHGEGETAGNIDLRGTLSGTYCVSYNQLVALSKNKEKQLLGYREHRDEDAAMNGIEYIPAYQTGALSSPLAAWLSERDLPQQKQYTEYLKKSHPEKIDISKADLLVLTNWMDVNCAYHPSYWGRLHEKFKDHADFRPAVSWKEATTANRN